MLRVAPISYFDRLPDVMLEVIIDFSCEDVLDILKVGRTERNGGGLSAAGSLGFRRG